MKLFRENMPNSFTNTTNKTYNLRKRLDKENLDPNRPLKKVAREYKSNSCGPSVSQEETDKIEGKSDPRSIEEHAHKRMQDFAVAIIGIYGIGVRSNGTIDPGFEFDLAPAYLQVGKAKNGKMKNCFHASHDNAAAGYTDNIRIRDIQTICLDQEITPKKEKRLRAKGFTDEDLDLIRANFHDFEKVVEIFDRVWPVNPLRPQSIFTGTYTELVLNSTTEAERGVNLVIDKWIELLRKEIKELYRKIIYKEITPEEACDQYQNLVLSHLIDFEGHLKNHRHHLAGYQEGFAKLEKYKDLEAHDFDENMIKEVTEILNSLRLMEKELNPPKGTIDDTSMGSHLSRIKLQRNKKFLNDSLYGLEKDEENPINKLKIWMTKKFDLLKSECQTQIDKVATYLKYNELEKTGTLLTDFKPLFNEPLSPVQKRTWKPLEKG
jgi:hypothetical protein